MIQERQFYELSYYLTKTLMQCILKEYLSTDELNKIMEHLQLNTQEEQIYFLTQFTLTLRKYPDTIFSTPEIRTNFINTAQESLDARILEENN